MRKSVLLLLVTFLIITVITALTACGGQQEQQHPDAGSTAGRDVDIDLTVLSSTMLFAELNNIMSNPESYIGKSIKISGPYYAFYYEITEMYYHLLIIEDAAACCTQIMEFVQNGDLTYPDDYPENGTNIEVTGIFSSYEELGETYYCLNTANVVY